MPQITRIAQQKKRNDRVSVYVDDEYWLGLRAELLYELGIAQGVELTPALRAQIMSRACERDALVYATGVLSGRACSESQIRQKLVAKEYGDDLVAVVIARLQELLLLDDAAYAAARCREVRDRGGWRTKARERLRRDGIAEPLASETIAECFPADDEREMIAALLPAEAGVAEAKRLSTRLIRRGFSSRLVSELAAERSPGEDSAVAEARHVLERQRKYSGDALRDRGVRQKAWAHLQRRGFSGGVISQALAAAQEE